MNLICRLFGHSPEEGYHRNSKNGDCYGYFKIVAIETDCVGRKHGYLRAVCKRCGMEYNVGMVHLPEDVLKEL